MKKKAFISLLGLSGYMPQRGGIQNATYHFSSSLQKKFGNLKKNIYPNMFPLVLDNFKDYEHIAIATPQSREVQKKILEHEKIDFSGKVIVLSEQEHDYSALLQQFNEVMEYYDQVIMDISHGFRHLPIISIFALFNQNIKNQNKIEHILLTKEIVPFKEYEINDLKENFELINLSYVLSSFNNNYTIPHNLQFSNRDYQELIYRLNEFSKYFTSNLPQLLQDNLIDKIITIAQKILDMNIGDLDNDLRFLMDNMKYIYSLKDKSEWIQFYEFSKLMNLVDNQFKAIIYLNDAVGFYCLDTLQKKFPEYIENYKDDKNRYRLINDTKNLIKLGKNFHGRNSNKDIILRYIKDIPNILSFQKFIREIDSLRNEVVHSSISLIRVEDTKYKYSKLLEQFERFCIREDVLSSIERDKTYLHAIKIRNYFSIKDIEITNLKDKKEIYFVGGNGDGKTILLQAIILGLKKEYSGQIKEYIQSQNERDILVKDEFSEDYTNRENIKNVFAYGVNRNKTHDEDFDKKGYSGLFDTSDFRNTTFLKRPLDVLKDDNELIAPFIEKLNKYIFKDKIKIKKDANQITFYDEDNLSVQFKEFSEGYKSTLIWICDLFSRLIENQKESNKKVTKLEDFKAIVLIDEIDLYLHPTWKYDFVYNLRKVFPNIQFIMITHSMVTILGASKDAVFYKVYKENGETKISQPMSSIKNLMANNLSTSPLFDMTTARARNSDENLKTDEDFIYTKIHEIVTEQMRGKKAIIEDEIVEAINKELDDYIKEQGL